VAYQRKDAAMRRAGKFDRAALIELKREPKRLEAAVFSPMRKNFRHR
jgi:SpoVK/Ycf46/Vps4 family AAA+-type ATPase